MERGALAGVEAAHLIGGGREVGHHHSDEASGCAGPDAVVADAARTRSRKHKREISLEYLTDEKHYPLGTTDEYFQAPEPDEEYILTLCGDTVIFSSGLLAEALSRLDEREREMIYLSFFKRIPQHEIGRQYGRSRSTAGYHIRKALRQLQAEMEGMAYEK